MRIFYTGVFGAALMHPISVGGFWMGLFSLAFLIPFIIAIRGIAKYIRLIKRGVKTYATITKTEKSYYRGVSHYDKYYFFTAEGRSYGGMFSVGYKTKRYNNKQKIEVRYDKDDPDKHIRVKDSLWEGIAVLFLTSIFFFCTFVMFIGELVKCFR